MWFVAEFWSKKQKNKKANSEGIRRKLRYFVGKKSALKYTHTREEQVIIFGISKEKTGKKNGNSEGIRLKLRHFIRKKHVLNTLTHGKNMQFYVGIFSGKISYFRAIAS